MNRLYCLKTILEEIILTIYKLNRCICKLGVRG
jgi:hypothetical protein